MFWQQPRNLRFRFSMELLWEEEQGFPFTVNSELLQRNRFLLCLKLLLDFFQISVPETAEMYSLAFEKLVPYTALQLKEAEERGRLLTAELEAALENKHVVCYIKYFNKLVRGAITRKYPLVKIYLYGDIFPNAEPPTEHAKPNPIMLENETVDLTKDSEDVVQFFTPSTKMLIEQISRSSQDNNVEDAGASACKRLLTFDDAQKSNITVKLEPMDDDDTVKSMPFESPTTASPGKRCKAKQS